ncbi:MULTISPECIES: RusA family crossover junction endodeoxyribonuclease [unclassified Asaia]|uniref:RusA family crossover junction endodeoxyribonuclease n=1 Tax=unclassified Asaia TaxID=2685023 RepID=UPI001F2108EB|nr:RusA family crossover junction endodeoxyribonuclease [Asaia sp. W19]
MDTASARKKATRAQTRPRIRAGAALTTQALRRGTTTISETRQAGIIQQAFDWIAENTSQTHTVTIEAEPRPESLRAAVRGGRAYVYKGKLYGEFLQACIEQVSKQRPETPLKGDLYGLMEVIVTKPKATKRRRPGGDVDNLVKGVQDALTQAKVYEDDDNLVSISAHKRWARSGEPAGVRVILGVLN